MNQVKNVLKYLGQEYIVKDITVGIYQEYIEKLNQGKTVYEILQFLANKLVYREKTLFFFWKTKKFDFKVELISMKNIDKFQDEFFKMLFGEDFLTKLQQKKVQGEPAIKE